MAGIYIHIPFCKQACYYCNFHFTTSLREAESMTSAILREMELRKDYLRGEAIDSIYLGGGTPSHLQSRYTSQLLNLIYSQFSVSDTAEITLEANPDDLTDEKLQDIVSLGVNRLSIGVQSFIDEDLIWMNRAHKGAQAEQSVLRAFDAGISNITIDLIYGIPILTESKLRHNINKVLSLPVEHISAYALTIEPKTALDTFIRKGRYAAPDEQALSEQFYIMHDVLSDHGFVQYEISNYAKNDKYAVHNSNYWKGTAYLGLGPAAHSFNGPTRQWNISNNALYIKRLLETGEVYSETEELTAANRFNEYVMTGLRTIWGCDISYMRVTFGNELTDHFLKKSDVQKEMGFIEQDGDIVRLTRKGKILADGIASDLFTL